MAPGVTTRIRQQIQMATAGGMTIRLGGAMQSMQTATHNNLQIAQRMRHMQAAAVKGGAHELAGGKACFCLCSDYHFEA